MTGKDMLKGIQNLDATLIEEAEFGKFQKHQAGISGKKKLLFLLAATLIMGTMTAAAVYTRWSTTAQTRYNPSQDVKEQAEKSGLSVMLEETKGKENPNEVLSVTDQGITITAVQTIVDNYHAEIIFRIEGFDLPENKEPSVLPIVSIDGKQDYYVSQSGWFFEGTTDGSLEYTHYISFQETDGRYIGKEIAVTFHSIDFQSDQKAGMPEPQVEGNWELKWTLTGTSDSITVTPNAKIGDSDVILLDAQIGQKSIRARYQVDDYWEGWNELVTLPQAVQGVRMKDGSEHICGASTSGFEDQENMIYFTESDIYDAILDINQVESLMFHKGWELDANGKPTIQTFYYIPVSVG